MTKTNPESSKKDIVIACLEFAREKLLNGEILNRADFTNFLTKNNYIKLQDVDTKRHLIKALFEQIASFQDNDFSSPVRFMGMDSYLALQGYEELQLARKDSAQARREAKEAIQHAEEATKLTKKALFWTKVSVIIATLVGILQILIPLIID